MCLFNFHLFQQSVDGYAIIAEYQCPTMLCRLFITFSSINIQYNKICIINIILDNIRRIYKTCFCFIFLKLVLFHLDVFFCPHLSEDSHRLKWVFAHQIPDYSTITCATVQLANQLYRMVFISEYRKLLTSDFRFFFVCNWPYVFFTSKSNLNIACENISSLEVQLKYIGIRFCLAMSLNAIWLEDVTEK